MLKSTRQFLTHCALVALILSSLAVGAAPPAFRTIAAPAEAPDAKALTLYVSPQGNDAWSGKLAAPNAGGTDGPVATVTKARDIVREIKANGLTKPITVLLRGGTYAQAKTLVFTAADSGTEACPITYQAYPGEAPIISGGQAITGWQRDEGGKLWRVQVPKTADGRKWRFNQSSLYLDFLAGNQRYDCTPWGNPTRNVFGWQKPCYLIGEGYVGSFRELMDETNWDSYGTGNYEKCADCMVHCGYEPTAVSDTVAHPLKALKVALGGIETSRPMVADTPLDNQRPAEYVFEELVRETEAGTSDKSEVA